jgi:hypothetical protein
VAEGRRLSVGRPAVGVVLFASAGIQAVSLEGRGGQCAVERREAGRTRDIEDLGVDEGDSTSSTGAGSALEGSTSGTVRR